MRKVLMLVAGLGLAFSFFLASSPQNAFAKTILVKLTQQQVATVCGGELKPGGGGHSGCTKSCGAKKHMCDYDCDKKGQCVGQCITCPQRKLPLGENAPKRVIKNAVRATQ